MADTLFNRAQLASWFEARTLMLTINNERPDIGGGVAPLTNDSDTSGIYTALWLPGPGNFPEPHWTDPETGIDYWPLLFRFNSGAAGHCVGLILDQANRHAAPVEPGYPPNDPNIDYALNSLKMEVDLWEAANPKP